MSGRGTDDGRRVVVTGMGVIAPNGNGLSDYELALRKGQSGLRHNAEMEAQTRIDTTTGEDKPMGERGADKADTLGETRAEANS